MTQRGMARTRILLVDDSTADTELALVAFEEAGLEGAVQVMRSGGEALDWLMRRTVRAEGTSDPLPDLILLDLKMPRLDGLAVLREVKANPAWRQIPVVILTSSREQSDISLCYEAGACSYLVKPVAFEASLDMVRKLVGYWLSLNVSPVPADRPS
jgi:two-component system response regulator